MKLAAFLTRTMCACCLTRRLWAVTRGNFTLTLCFTCDLNAA